MSNLNQLTDSYSVQACNIVNKMCSRKYHTAEEVFKLLDIVASKLQPCGKAFKRLVELHRSSHKF